MSLVVDASVVVKWFVEEDLSAQADFLLVAADRLWAPDLLLAEAGNTFWKKWRRGEMTSAQAGEAIRQLTAGPLNLEASAHLIEPAQALSMQIDHPVCDCLYLACAESRDEPLVTADRRLLVAVRNSVLEGRVRHLETIEATPE